MFDDLPDRIKLSLGNNRRLSAPSHNVDNSRCGEYLEPPVHSFADKHVAWEQREPELPGTVLPLLLGTIEREIDLVTFIRKRERDGFFVLMPRKNGVPIWCAGRVLNFHFHLRHLHVALPSDLRKTLTPNSTENCLAGLH